MSREWGAMVPPYLGFDLTGGRSLVAKESGIVEPITAALRTLLPSRRMSSGSSLRDFGNGGRRSSAFESDTDSCGISSEMDAPHASGRQEVDGALDKRVSDRLELEIRPNPS